MQKTTGRGGKRERKREPCCTLSVYFERHSKATPTLSSHIHTHVNTHTLACVLKTALGRVSDVYKTGQEKEMDKLGNRARLKPVLSPFTHIHTHTALTEEERVEWII